MSKIIDIANRRPTAAKETLHWVGEPDRICGNCDHFRRTKLAAGQCRNGISSRFSTSARDKACMRGFYPDTQRFPLHVRLGIVPAQ